MQYMAAVSAQNKLRNQSAAIDGIVRLISAWTMGFVSGSASDAEVVEFKKGELKVKDPNCCDMRNR